MLQTDLFVSKPQPYFASYSHDRTVTLSKLKLGRTGRSPMSIVRQLRSHHECILYADTAYMDRVTEMDLV